MRHNLSSKPSGFKRKLIAIFLSILLTLSHTPAHASRTESIITRSEIRSLIPALAKFFTRTITSPLSARSEARIEKVKEFQARLRLPIERGNGWIRIVSTHQEAEEFNESRYPEEDAEYSVQFNWQGEVITHIFPLHVLRKMKDWADKSPDLERMGYFIGVAQENNIWRYSDFKALGSITYDPEITSEAHGDDVTQESGILFDPTTMKQLGMHREIVEGLGIPWEDLSQYSSYYEKIMLNQEEDVRLLPWHSHLKVHGPSSGDKKIDSVTHAVYTVETRGLFLFQGQVVEEVNHGLQRSEMRSEARLEGPTVFNELRYRAFATKNHAALVEIMDDVSRLSLSINEKLTFAAELLVSSPHFKGNKPPFFVPYAAQVSARQAYQIHSKRTDQDTPLTVLSYGVGDGRRIYELLLFYRALGLNNVRVIGIDYDDKQVSIAKELIPDGEFHMRDLLEWSEEDPAFRSLREQVHVVDASYLIHEIYSFGGNKGRDDLSIDREVGIREVHKLLSKTEQLLAPDGVIVVSDGTVPENARQRFEVTLSPSYLAAYKALAEQYRPYNLPEVTRELDSGEGVVTLNEEELAILLDKGTFFTSYRRRDVGNERLNREMSEKLTFWTEREWLSALEASGLSPILKGHYLHQTYHLRDFHHVKLPEGVSFPYAYSIYIAQKKSSHESVSLVRDPQRTMPVVLPTGGILKGNKSSAVKKLGFFRPVSEGSEETTAQVKNRILEKRRSKAGEVTFIAIDGNAGSVKTQFTNQLSEQLSTEDIPNFIFRADWFLKPRHEWGPLADESLPQSKRFEEFMAQPGIKYKYLYDQEEMFRVLHQIREEARALKPGETYTLILKDVFNRDTGLRDIPEIKIEIPYGAVGLIEGAGILTDEPHLEKSGRDLYDLRFLNIIDTVSQTSNILERELLKPEPYRRDSSYLSERVDKLQVPKFREYVRSTHMLNPDFVIDWRLARRPRLLANPFRTPGANVSIEEDENLTFEILFPFISVFPDNNAALSEQEVAFALSEIRTSGEPSSEMRVDSASVEKLFSENGFDPKPDEELAGLVAQNLEWMTEKDLVALIDKTRFRHQTVKVVDYGKERVAHWYDLRKILTLLPNYFEVGNAINLPYEQSVRLLFETIDAIKDPHDPSSKYITQLVYMMDVVQTEGVDIQEALPILIALIQSTKAKGYVDKALLIVGYGIEVGLSIPQIVAFLSHLNDEFSEEQLPRVYYSLQNELYDLRTNNLNAEAILQALITITDLSGDQPPEYSILSKILYAGATQTRLSQEQVMQRITDAAADQQMTDQDQVETGDRSLTVAGDTSESSGTPAHPFEQVASELTVQIDNDRQMAVGEIKDPDQYFPDIGLNKLAHGIFPYRVRKGLQLGLHDLFRLMRRDPSEGAWIYDPETETWFSLGGRTEVQSSSVQNRFLSYDISRLSQTPVYIHIHPEVYEDLITPLSANLSLPQYREKIGKFNSAMPRAGDFELMSTLLKRSATKVSLNVLIVTSLGVTEVQFPKDTEQLDALASTFMDIKNAVLTEFDVEAHARDHGVEEENTVFVQRLTDDVNRKLPKDFKIVLHPMSTDFEAVISHSEVRSEMRDKEEILQLHDHVIKLTWEDVDHVVRDERHIEFLTAVFERMREVAPDVYEHIVNHVVEIDIYDEGEDELEPQQGGGETAIARDNGKVGLGVGNLDKAIASAKRDVQWDRYVGIFYEESRHLAFKKKYPAYGRENDILHRGDFYIYGSRRPYHEIYGNFNEVDGNLARTRLLLNIAESLDGDVSETFPHRFGLAVEIAWSLERIRGYLDPLNVLEDEFGRDFLKEEGWRLIGQFNSQFGELEKDANEYIRRVLSVFETQIGSPIKLWKASKDHEFVILLSENGYLYIYDVDGQEPRTEEIKADAEIVALQLSDDEREFYLIEKPTEEHARGIDREGEWGRVLAFNIETGAIRSNHYPKSDEFQKSKISEAILNLPRSELRMDEETPAAEWLIESVDRNSIVDSLISLARDQQAFVVYKADLDHPIVKKLIDLTDTDESSAINFTLFMANGIALTEDDLESIAKSIGISLRELRQELTLPDWAKSLVIVKGISVTDGRRYDPVYALLHEVFHLLEGPVRFDNDWKEGKDSNDVLESVNTLLNLMFFNKKSSTQFGYAYQRGLWDYTFGANLMPALIDHYRENPGLNPNRQTGEIIRAIHDDVRDNRSIHFDGRSVPIVNILATNQRQREFLPIYLAILQRHQKFSDYEFLFNEALSEVRNLIDLEAALENEVQVPATLFMNAEMLASRSEMRREAFAVVHQMQQHDQFHFVIFGAEKLGELYKQFANLKNVRLVSGGFHKALSKYKRTGQGKNVRLVGDATIPSIDGVDNFLLRQQSTLDIWAALLYAISENVVWGISKIGSAYQVVSDLLSSQLQQFRASIVVRMAA